MVENGSARWKLESGGVKIVLMVTRAEPVGGAQIHVRDLATALRAQGHVPTVITSGSGQFIEDLRARSIPVIILDHLTAPMRPIQDLRALQELLTVLKELRPDLLTAHGAKVGILGRVAARTLRIPLIVTVHGWACAPGTPRLQAAVSRRLERLIGPLATKLITVSDFDRRFGVESRLVHAHRVVTVHNGMPDVPPTLRSSPGEMPPRLIMVARFEPQKDHITLLRALGGVQDRRWELELIGDGPLRSQMESLAEDLGIKGQVHFRGQRKDVAELLARAQISLLISNWEGFPLSILESMRAGLPVVASAVGGVEESVRDQETGYLVPRGDADTLRDRIERLLTDPSLRVKLGANGRRAYEQHFTLERMVAKTLAVYGEVLEPLRPVSGSLHAISTGLSA
ncbi:MAG TPA: glycosyltransferase family 4 protein [Gemmatimonadales bacterium]|nr:glycosyltransferase family 4 protein [Gemmatimonadales bacterium]